MGEHLFVSNDYVVSDRSVTLRGTPVPGADPKTFQHLYGPWSRDAKSVFWAVFRLTKPNPNTFVALNDIWGHDDTAAYPSSGKPVTGVNVPEFRTFDAGVLAPGGPSLAHPLLGGFAGDGQRVFFHLNPYPSAWEVKKADAETFVSLGHRYGRDARSVFSEQRLMKGARPQSFYVINKFYAADDSSVFYAGRKVDGADPHSFVLLWDYHGMEARDRHRCYSGGNPSTRERYLVQLRKNDAWLKQHATSVENGAFDEHYRKMMVDYRA